MVGSVLIFFLVFCVVWCALVVLVLCLVPNVTCVSGLFILASSVFSNVYIQNKNGGKTRNTVHEFLFSLISIWIQMKSVPDLDKKRPYAIPFTRPLPIPHLHDWRKMEVCLINFNKGEGCLKFYNILKWNAIV